MTRTDKVNILLGDDHPAKLLTYEAMLDDLGENLIKAGSSTEVLEQLLKHDVAVILMDVNMPEMDGFEIADIIRQHPRFHDTAIIFISAVQLTDVDRLKGYQRGALDYISVPVVPEVLRAKVRIFVDLYRKTKQLEQSEGRFRGLIEQAPIGITLVDRDFRLLKVNAAFCRMLGYSEAELMRLTSLDVTHADDRQSTIDLTERLFKGAISIRTQDKRYVTKNGEVIWGKVTASLIHLEDKPLYVAMIEDITERKRTEAALKQSEGRLRGLIEQAPIGITLVDRDFRLLKVNAAFCCMLGYSEAELMRLTSLDVTHADDRQPTINLTERLFKAAISMRTQEKRYVTKNGEVIWGKVTASLIHLEDKPLYVAMIEDITERKR